MRWTFVALSAGIAVGLGVYRARDPVPVPGYADVRAAYRTSERQLLDRHGEPIHELRVDPGRRRLAWTALGDISPVVLAAVVLAEDRRFFAHGGVDWRAAAGALWSALRGGPRRGASTLTMQLAAQLDRGLRAGSDRRGPGQKWAQMRAAWALEAAWDKRRILEAYLNLVSFRGEIQGIAAASRGLFGKDPAGLDAAESWLLASLLGAPNAGAERVAKRACRLARAGPEPVPCGRLTDLAVTALRSTPHLAPRIALAPHVARKLLADPAGPAAPRATQTGGSAPIASTLDADLQRYARAALGHRLRELADRNVHHGAVLVADNRSGAILAYAGNTGEDPGTFYVDGVQAPRQAGSTLKPFLYALAIEERYLTAASPIDDSPVNLTTATGLYVPHNYDRTSRGLVSLRTALGASLNVPAVRTLMLVGTERFLERLRALGFAHLTRDGDYYGYSLALGSAEVTLAELVNAYRTLANGGVASALTLRPRQAPAPTRAIIDAGAAFIVSDILADRAARSPSFGLDNALATPFPSAVKTGTSKDMRDNWCIGYSERYTVGVWVGNFGGEPMHDVSGITGAAPVWYEIMERLHRGRRNPAPSPLEAVLFSPLRRGSLGGSPAGVVATDIVFDAAIEPPRREWFLEGTAMPHIAQALPDARRPRIVYPGRDMIIALDPDIPVRRQRLLFRAEPALAGLRWQIDRVPWASGGGWQPVPGRHRIVLLDANGKVQDTVGFEVRGRP